MTAYLEVNPEARSTWVNHPRPGDFPEFDRELLELGGRHPTGRQMLTLDWAPEVKKVRLGRMRHAYVDDRIPCHRVERSLGYKVKRVGVEEDWRYIDCMELDKYGPEYLVFPVQETDCVVIAWQRWIVRQYVPPERMDEGPKAWEARRYRTFTPPETNRAAYGDDIGPYPSEGVYDLLLVIQSPVCSDVYDYRGEYREPARDVLEQVKAALKARDAHHDGRTFDQRVESDFAEAELREEQWRAELDDNLDAALGWHGRANEGDALVSMYNPSPVNKGAKSDVGTDAGAGA